MADHLATSLRIYPYVAGPSRRAFHGCVLTREDSNRCVVSPGSRLPTGWAVRWHLRRRTKTLRRCLPRQDRPRAMDPIRRLPEARDSFRCRRRARPASRYLRLLGYPSCRPRRVGRSLTGCSPPAPSAASTCALSWTPPEPSEPPAVEGFVGALSSLEAPARLGALETLVGPTGRQVHVPAAMNQRRGQANGARPTTLKPEHDSLHR